MDQRRTCPECNLTFDAPAPDNGVLACPLCNTVLSAVPPPSPSPAVAPSAASASHVLKGSIALAVLLLLAGGLVYGYRLMEHLATKPIHPAKTTEPPESAPAPPPPLVVEIIPSPPERTPAPPLPPQLPRNRVATVSRTTSPAEEARPRTLAEQVNQAIDHGVAYLRTKHSRHAQYRNYDGLLGLTLLECGVPASDPVVQQLAALVRGHESQLFTTYELSLAILFLDRLNYADDEALILTFGRRLAAGQLEGGTWTYSCRATSSPSAAVRRQQLTPRRNARSRAAPPASPKVHFRGDNSNTQFALLGLWVAQRHGILPHRALLASQRYFRSTQLPDGSWSYHAAGRAWPDSMTCAGLLGMAMGYGASQGGGGKDLRSDQPIRVWDGSVNRGLSFLGEALNKVTVEDKRIRGVEGRDPLYFLWSLQRMAHIYGLERIGTREWYPWAAALLVQVQQSDGSWEAPYPSPVGTCFALLVLRRSNLASDLQLAVQGPSSGTRMKPITQTPKAAPAGTEMKPIMQAPKAEPSRP